MRSKFCFVGWIAAGFLGVLALIPFYFYLRLMFGLLGAVIAGYCLIALLRKKRPEAARILWGSLTSLVIIGGLIFAVTGGLILHGGLGDPETPCDYILVLGAKVREDGPSLSLQERISAAYDYLIAHPQATAIVTGGKGDDEHISEAQCMYQELTGMGIDPQRILMEDQATSTWENLTYSLDLIEDRTGVRPNRVGVVTSEYHLFRTGLQAREQNLTIVGIPAETGSFPRFFHFFVREIAGVWHYILLGGQQI